MTCPACGNDDPRMIDVGKTYAVCEVCSKIWKLEVQVILNYSDKLLVPLSLRHAIVLK